MLELAAPASASVSGGSSRIVSFPLPITRPVVFKQNCTVSYI